MRVFEAVACGSMLVTNDLRDNGQAELFRDGVHLATYQGPEELLDKVAFYLAREGLRERIADAGREEAVAKHTYAHRMERLLRAAEVGLSKSTVSVPVSPPVDSRDRSYFEHARPELLALIPSSARTVLDIGCGAGRLGEAVKARQRATVVGVEIDKAAQLAESRLDRVFIPEGSPTSCRARVAEVARVSSRGSAASRPRNRACAGFGIVIGSRSSVAVAWRYL